MRAPIAEGRADFVPVFLSDIPDLLTSGEIELDAALLQLSPPNSARPPDVGHLGSTRRWLRRKRRSRAAEVNDQMPRTLAQVAASALKAFVYTMNRAVP